MRLLHRTPRGVQSRFGTACLCTHSVQEEAKRNAPAAARFCAAIDRFCNGDATDFRRSIQENTAHLQGGLR